MEINSKWISDIGLYQGIIILKVGKPFGLQIGHFFVNRYPNGYQNGYPILPILGRDAKI